MTTFSADPERALPGRTLLLSRGDVASLLGLPECIEAVEQAFCLHAEGRTLPPGVLGVPANGGGFHIKAAGLKLDRTWFAVKCNGNFFGNPARFGMPSIQGLILLCDGDNGYPLAVIDSIEITILRTGAATGVAARRLARPDSKVATIIGCGNQGRVQLEALSAVRRLARAHAVDLDPARAVRFADEMSARLPFPVEAATDLTAALRGSDIAVTCTPARRPVVTLEQIPPGLFLAAVGADSPDKQELDPRILAAARLVTDSLDQCAAFGELHHALAAGSMTRDQVHADLAEVVSGRRPGRVGSAEITVFDSTGTALQDVAAAVTVYEKALRAGAGTPVSLIG